MKRRWTSRGAIVAVLAVFAGMSFPGPAQAYPLCHGWVGTDESTIGVGGNPVTTTPELHVQVCAEIAGTPTNPTLPGVSVECVTSICPNAQGTWVTVSPYDLGGVRSVTINYTFDGDLRSVTVPLPTAPPGGSEVCVFYIGRAVNNPGGCLVFYNHGI